MFKKILGGTIAVAALAAAGYYAYMKIKNGEVPEVPSIPPTVE